MQPDEPQARACFQAVPQVPVCSPVLDEPLVRPVSLPERGEPLEQDEACTQDGFPAPAGFQVRHGFPERDGQRAGPVSPQEPDGLPASAGFPVLDAPLVRPVSPQALDELQEPVWLRVRWLPQAVRPEPQVSAVSLGLHARMPRVSPRAPRQRG